MTSGGYFILALAILGSYLLARIMTSHLVTSPTSNNSGETEE